MATMLGSMLTKEEVEEFMREADVVSSGLITNVTMKKIILKHVMGSLNIFLIFPISHKYKFYFQDGNGKLDYDEFVKMMLQY